MEKVEMVHPDLEHTKDTPVVISKTSFEQVWKKAGWRLAPKKKATKKEESS